MPQFRHLRRLRFVIGWDPPAADDAHLNAGAGPRKKTRRRKRRNGYRKLFEADAVEENGKFRPVESVHFQIGDGTVSQTLWGAKSNSTHKFCVDRISLPLWRS